jgi:hypothetical protein
MTLDQTLDDLVEHLKAEAERHWSRTRATPDTTADEPKGTPP